MIRLHVDAPLLSGAAVAPRLDQSRYLTQVMRLGIGDAILLFNGRDGEWRAEVAETLKRGVVLRALEQTRPQAMGPDLDLIIAVVRKARVETIVEKAAELGARRVRLALTQRTNADRLRLDRLAAIAEEAAEQTGRLDVPDIHAPVKLEALLADWPAERRLIFCDEGGGAPAVSALSVSALSVSAPGQAGAGPWSILIGPEGGFSPEEQAVLRALPYATAVSLGPRILRADTAAIAALTLWQAALGDWER